MGLLDVKVQVVHGMDRFVATPVRFPRSKRKRIRKKWAKRPENWRQDLDPCYFQFQDMFICGPRTFQWLRNHPDVEVRHG